MVFGIPFVSVLINTLLYGHLLQDNARSQFGACIIIALIYTSIYWVSFRMIFRFFVIKYPDTIHNKKRQVITSLFVLGTYFILQFILDIFLRLVLKNQTSIPEPDAVLKIITSLIFTVLVLAVYEGLYLSLKIRQNEEEKNQMIQDSISSQLAGLKNQINPHFLFNSLNTLSSLVHEDADRADAFIGKLSKVYRYILDKYDDHLVTLGDEMNYLHSYLYLMKERFGENLHYTEKIDDKLLHKYVLPMSLQITFENCLKHNIITKEKPLFITVETSDDGKHIIISNNLQKLIFPSTTKALGLENIKKRYNFFTDSQVIIDEKENVFKVILPLLDDDSFKKIK